MAQVQLPSELAPVLEAIRYSPGTPAARLFMRCLQRGVRFDPRLPLRLYRWCTGGGAACDGDRLLRVTLTGFRLSPWRRAALLAAALEAVAAARLAVRRGDESRLMRGEGVWIIEDPVPRRWGPPPFDLRPRYHPSLGPPLPLPTEMPPSPGPQPATPAVPTTPPAAPQGPLAPRPVRPDLFTR